MSVNKVILVGNVGKDPVIRYFDKGVAKATFPLATSETYTNQQGETITSTEWHNIVLWRALAEVAEKSVKKGSQLYIVGKIKTRSYVDKDGNNKYITEILADAMMVLDKKQGTGTNPPHADTSNQDRGSMPPEINEPASYYQKQGDNQRKPGPEKSPSANEEQGPFNNGSFSGQNEDDLPF